MKRLVPVNYVNTSIETSAGNLSPFSNKTFTAVQQMSFEYLEKENGLEKHRTL